MVPCETRRCRVAERPIRTEAAKRLFAQLLAEGIPIEQSVPFLIRARGWRIQAFCEDIGIHRGYLHALLKRQYAAQFGIRLAVHKRLGFDPWQDNETTSAGMAARAVVASICATEVPD